MNCSGQKRIPRVSQNYFHIGGFCSRKLSAVLVQIERDFVAGADISNRFWKPEERKVAEKPTVADNVVQFPGAVSRNDDELG